MHLKGRHQRDKSTWCMQGCVPTYSTLEKSDSLTDLVLRERILLLRHRADYMRKVNLLNWKQIVKTKNDKKNDTFTKTKPVPSPCSTNDNRQTKSRRNTFKTMWQFLFVCFFVFSFSHRLTFRRSYFQKSGEANLRTWRDSFFEN